MEKNSIKGLTAPLKLIGIVHIHLSVFILFAAALFFDYIKPLMLAYSILMLHETAHIIAALLLHTGISAIEIYPFGACIKLKNSEITRPRDEGIIASAGPLCNLILTLICYLLIRCEILNLQDGLFIASASIIMGFVNLLPIVPLDGGRILKAVLTEKLGYIKAYGKIKLISIITAVLLFIFGAAALYYTKFNFSLLIISAFVSVNLLSEQKGYSLALMKDIVFSKKKIAENEVLPTGHITISENAPARKILKLLSYHKYYIINIVDENGNIVKTVTETKLMDSLINKNIRISGKEI